MDSALQAKGNAIYQDTSTDLHAYVGYLTTFSAGVPAVNTSTTVPAVGLVLDARTRTPIAGGTTYYDNAIGILGGLPGPCRVILNASSAALNFGDVVMQASDGTVTKEVTGSARVVVGICSDKNGANPGDLFEIATFTPSYRTY
jgi:hypothetical protein